MKYFGWSLNQIKELTVPGYFELIQTINDIEIENEIGNKKKRHK